MTSPTSNSLPFSFINKKAKILADLSTPVTSYVDASPKGSIDIGIVDLINAINELPEYVTTSSCAGRISVFVEGKKGTEKSENEEGRADGIERGSSQSGERETRAGTGGKGGGGKWLYVSHDPLLIRDGQDLVDLLGMARKIEEKEITLKEQRLVRFKFEPMVSHFYFRN
jgi:tRNA wybutosine-synthesizing protein 3